MSAGCGYSRPASGSSLGTDAASSQRACHVNVRPRSGQAAAACRSCHSVSSLQTSLRLSRVDKKLRSACHASAFVTGCGQGLSYGAESCAPHSWHSAHSAAGSVLDELWRCCGAHWAHGRLVRAEGGFLSPSELDSLRLHSVATRRSLPYLRLGAPDANRAASAPLSSLIGPRPAGSLVHRRARVLHVLPGQSPASRHSVKPFRRASYKLIRLKSRQGERTSSPALADRHGRARCPQRALPCQRAATVGAGGGYVPGLPLGIVA